MDLAGMNIRKITDYFRAGCKEDYNRRIGVEIEHFVIKEDNTNATYEEIAELLEAVFGNEQCEYEQRSLLGCVTMEYAISLEPAAQLEISIFPRKTVQELEQIYEGFLKRMESYLGLRHMRLETCGYQPYAKAAELPLIPKRRYEYMDAYFKHTETMGIRMMRGSASTQVSIDYLNEQDFVKKFQLAQMLSPVLALLTENTAVIDGIPVKKHIPRTDNLESCGQETVRNCSGKYERGIFFLHLCGICLSCTADLCEEITVLSCRPESGRQRSTIEDDS